MISTLSRPKIPGAWYRPSPLWTLAMLTYAPLLVAVPAVIARLALGHLHPWPLAAVSMLPFLVVAGYGYQLMGFVGHEGMHLSLMKNKLRSACTGLFYASSVVSYFELGFAAQHWSHHRYTNQKSDPDIPPVGHLDTWWKRVLFARATYNLDYFRTTWLLARGGAWPFPYRIPFNRRIIGRLGRVNLAFAAIWVAFYLVLAIREWRLALCLGLSMICALLISACQTFLDHAGVGDEPFRNAWSRTSPFMSAVYFGANYHLEHHLYPGVPCYRLHKVHRLLRETGLLEREGVHVQPSFWKAYTAVAKTYVAGGADLDADPFASAADPGELVGVPPSRHTPLEVDS